MEPDIKNIKELLEKSSEDEKFEIINSLESDEEKLVSLIYLKNDYNTLRIALTLKTDEMKLKSIEYIKTNMYKKRIIENLKSDKLKLEYIEEIKSEYEKSEIIKSLESDELKIELLEKYDFIENIKIGIIKSFKKDELKIKYIESINNEELKLSIAKTLRKESSKIEILKYITDEELKSEIIIGMKSDKNKAEAIKYIGNEIIKKRLVEYIKDKTYKIEAIKELTVEDQIVIALGLKDRELIEKIIGNPETKYKNLTLDKNMTIGIEIESEGERSGDIRRTKVILDRWKTKFERSLQQGIEVVSPILKNNRKDIKDIYAVCEILKKAKQKITPKCGGHVHIGANYITTEEGYLNLLEIWGNAENLIYIISNKEGEVLRKDFREFAKGITSNEERAMEKGTIKINEKETLEEFSEGLKGKVQRHNRYTGLNLLNINQDGKNTIEFRMANGTLDADTWIENIKLFGRIIEKSEKLGIIERKNPNTRTEEENKIIKTKEKLKEKKSDNEKIEILLELLFEEKEKETYRRRYKINSELLKEEENKEIKKEIDKMKAKKPINFHKDTEYKKIAETMREEEINTTSKYLKQMKDKNKTQEYKETNDDD